jgi:N-formylglutamate amidohydrolase
VDPERFLDPAAEMMESRGMGAVYTRTSDGVPLRQADAARRDALLARWFHPYTDALDATLADLIARHGRAVIVDLHSYPSARMPHELGEDQRPEVCVGTDDAHTPEWLADRVERACADAGFGTARNSPFSGAYVPRQHLGATDVASVMLEIRRDQYLDEPTATPNERMPEVRRLVARIVAEVARPAAPPSSIGR